MLKHHFFLIFNKKNTLILLFLLIISLILPYSLLITSNTNFNNNVSIKVIIYIIEVFLLFGILIILYSYIMRVNINIQKTTSMNIKILYYALPSITIWSLYLIALYPGIMTNDSFNQWMQVQTHTLYDWHPVPHTIFIYFITQIWNSPSAVALTQMIIQALVLGYTLYVFEKFGINKKILFGISLLFALYPSNAVMSIALWKDIPYNSALILMTIFIAHILMTNENWINKPVNIISFIFCTVVIVSFRHNGLLSFIGTMLIALVVLKKSKKTFILILVSVLTIYAIIKGPIYNYLNVIPGTSNEAFGIPTQQIAAVVKNNGYLTNYQKEKIAMIMPLQVIAETYHPYSVDLIKFNDNFNRDIIVNDKIGFLKLWLKICIQNPRIVTKAFLDQTSLVWQIREPYGRGYTFTANRTVVKNDYNIETKIIYKPLTGIIYKILDFTENKRNIWIFWRPALPLFLILFFGCISISKNTYKSLVLLTPILLNNLTILAAIPAQDYRYLHANNLVSIIILLFSFIEISKLTK